MAQSMTINEIESEAALRRHRMLEAGVHFRTALKPANLLDSAAHAALGLFKKNVPALGGIAGQEMGKSAMQIIIAAAGTLITGKIIQRFFKTGAPSTGVSPALQNTTSRTAVAPSYDPTRNAKQYSAKRPDMMSYIKAAATAAAGLAAGHLLSRKISPTSIERALIDRHGSGFQSFVTDFLKTNETVLKKGLIDTFGMTRHISTGMTMLSFAAAILPLISAASKPQSST